MRRIALCVVLAAGCSGEPPANNNPPEFQSNCTVAEPTAEAKLPAGKQTDGSVLLPGGRRITPAGRLLDVGGFPLAMRVLPGDRYVVVTDGDFGDEALRIVDLQATDPHGAIVSSAAYPRTEQTPHAPALFYGMALTRDGKRLYVSDGGYDPVDDSLPPAQHYNTVDAFDIAGDPPQLTRNDAQQIKLYFSVSNGGAASPRLTAGLQLSSDEKLLYVATQTDASLAIVDLTPGMGYGAEIGRAAIPGVNPYDVAIDEASHTAFLSLWGGSKQNGKWVEGVVAVDVTDPMKPMAMMAPLATGKAAEAELLVGGRLLVANADADTISAIDLASKAVSSQPVMLGSLIGASPNALAVDAQANRLYVANANENAVVVLDLATLTPKGKIPTAWYPTAVTVLGDGTVVIASAKGLGLGPTDHEKGKDEYMQGVLTVLAKPSDADLTAGVQKVADNLTRPRQIEPKLTCPTDGEKRFPLRADVGSPTPIEHVFLIVRENKTYDVVMGDFAGANGDPKLTLFGAGATPATNVTPNAHALAKQFVLLDNFYSNAEQSLQGHEWTTACFSNDYTEKAWSATWGRGYRPLGAFATGYFERLSLPGADTVWTHLDHAGIDYHNYGEITNASSVGHPYDVSYPGLFFNLGTKDVDKVAYIVSLLQDPTFVLEPFSYIGLPNDHTYGTQPGKPTPQSMVADNDEATGRFIDALSHSDYWKSSIVFIIEDDPQDGGDHVEGHRSPAWVISPWVKHGYVSSVHYDNPSLFRTIDLLLGVGPMNGFDGNAAAMYDVFATTRDDSTYTAIPRAVPEQLNSADAPLADQSMKIDFTRPDSAPLGQILWRAVRGVDPPWGAKPSPRGDVADDDDD